MYEYIFFDLDGTVTDPGVGITNAVMYALEKFGIELPDRSELYKFIGPPLMESFSEFYGFDVDKCRQAIIYYREYYGDKGLYENEVYDGIKELLAELKRRGKKIVLATSKPEKFANQILDYFGLAEYFDFVAGAAMDETRTGKSQVLKYALEMTGATDVSKIVMIGDRKHDMIGASEFGLAKIGVLYGYGDRQELEVHGADYIVATPGEILDIV